MSGGDTRQEEGYYNTNIIHSNLHIIGLIANFVVLNSYKMNIGDNIKRIRAAKNLSQKEVITIAKLDAAQYSRIESGKTDPSVSTLERIAKALGVSLADLFASTDELKEINSYDKSIMEKVALMEALTKEEKHTIYTMLDAFIGKRKLKDALQNVLHDVK